MLDTTRLSQSNTQGVCQRCDQKFSLEISGVVVWPFCGNCKYCERCNGAGVLMEERKRCIDCRGKGWVKVGDVK